MQSNLYWYYEIRKDATYLYSLPTKEVLKALEDTMILQKTTSQSYCNKEGVPWMNIAVVNSDKGNYGREEHFNSEHVNMISVVGSKSSPENEHFYINMLTAVRKN